MGAGGGWEGVYFLIFCAFFRFLLVFVVFSDDLHIDLHLLKTSIMCLFI